MQACSIMIDIINSIITEKIKLTFFSENKFHHRKEVNYQFFKNSFTLASIYILSHTLFQNQQDMCKGTFPPLFFN